MKRLRIAEFGLRSENGSNFFIDDPERSNPKSAIRNPK